MFTRYRICFTEMLCHLSLANHLHFQTALIWRNFFVPRTKKKKLEHRIAKYKKVEQNTKKNKNNFEFGTQFFLYYKKIKYIILK